MNLTNKELAEAFLTIFVELLFYTVIGGIAIKISVKILEWLFEKFTDWVWKRRKGDKE